MGITVNEKELREILELTPSTQNIMIAGKHGIGKSVIIKNFFEAKGKKVVICFCSQAADAGDIIGLPRFNEATGKTEFALPWWFPKARFLPSYVHALLPKCVHIPYSFPAH